MGKELVISANRHETKVAILEDDQLVEVYFQRSNEYSLAGSIHKGRVTRVLPGMQSAFVDLGLERDTFLYVSDFFEENGDDIDRISDDRDRERERAPRQERVIAPPPPPPPVVEEIEAVVVEEPPAAPVEEAEPQPLAAVSAPPPHADRGAGEESGDNRDRRGRRSRRRRNRGRGFPESKYAAPHTGAAPVESDVEPEREPVVEEPEDESSFAVLPGESLAKYRHDSASEADEPEDGEETSATSESVEPEPEPEPVAAEEPVVPAPSEDALPADIAVIANDNPEELPPANAIPDAPAHHAAKIIGPVAPEPEPEPEPVAAAPVEAAQPVETLEADEVAELLEASDVEAGDVEAAEIEVEVEALIADEFIDSDGMPEESEAASLPDRIEDDDEDREIQALILDGHAEEPSSEEASAPMTANVREQNPRYMHRVSRRMRRRMRGPGPENSVAQPVAPAPPPRQEARPEHRPAPRAERPERGDRTPTPSITDLLKEGQEILVQIAKEPLGQKGARITSHIALPGRYVVYMPTLDHMGVSRKIASDDERLRLKKVLQKARVGLSGGFIIRTAGEGKSEEDIAADMSFLANLWLDIRQKAEKRPAPALLHHDLDIVQRVLRDQVNDTFKSVWVDSEEVYERIVRFLQRFQPTIVTRVKLYTRPAPIFDAFNITAELEKALRPKVWLKSGGYIVINQTEALVAIDVNTGKFVGKSNRLEDTIVKTNTEAVKEIVRQVRLRDLGGIIVIDFIDMDERKNRQKVMQALEEAMRSDRAPYKILQFNDFGLVAITRKRVKQSLERTLCSPCPYCEGAGYVKSVQTIIGEILQEANKIARAVEGQNVVLRVHPDVAKVLKSNSNRYLEELEEILKRPVLVTSDPAIHHEKYDLA